MNIPDVKIGDRFQCGNDVWRCTDIGTRVIIGVKLPKNVDPDFCFAGPPYSVAEIVFDEDDLQACTLTRRNLP